jgi:hypothetical protein
VSITRPTVDVGSLGRHHTLAGPKTDHQHTAWVAKLNLHMAPCALAGARSRLRTHTHINGPTQSTDFHNNRIQDQGYQAESLQRHARSAGCPVQAGIPNSSRTLGAGKQDTNPNLTRQWRCIIEDSRSAGHGDRCIALSCAEAMAIPQGNQQRQETRVQR